MGKPNLRWLKRYTTAEDLLDDGIENFSDLARLDDSADDAAPSPESVAIRRRTIELNRKEQEQRFAVAYRRAFSLLGLGLGALIALGGIALLAFPTDMLVDHARIRYLSSVVEHVTQTTSRLYGGALLLGGLAIVWFAFYRPRRL